MGFHLISFIFNYPNVHVFFSLVLIARGRAKFSGVAFLWAQDPHLRLVDGCRRNQRPLD